MVFIFLAYFTIISLQLIKKMFIIKTMKLG